MKAKLSLKHQKNSAKRVLTPLAAYCACVCGNEPTLAERATFQVEPSTRHSVSVLTSGLLKSRTFDLSYLSLFISILSILPSLFISLTPSSLNF